MAWDPFDLRIPVEQQDALPVFRTGEADTSYVTIIGNTLFKYWSPARLGFSVPAGGVPFPPVANKGSVSNTISLLGCKELVLIAKRTLAAPPPAADSIKAYIWPQASDGAASLVRSDNLFGFNSNGNAIVPVSPVVGVGTYIYNFTFAVGLGSGGSGNYTGAWPMEYAKIAVLGFGTAGDLSFTWEMWGQN